FFICFLCSIFVTFFILFGVLVLISFFFFFFFNDTATTEIYTLSLHDALPIPTVIGSSTGSSSVACVLRSTVIVPGASACVWSEYSPVCWSWTLGPGSYAGVAFVQAMSALLQDSTEPLLGIALDDPTSDPELQKAPELEV